MMNVPSRFFLFTVSTGRNAQNARLLVQLRTMQSRYLTHFANRASYKSERERECVCVDSENRDRQRECVCRQREQRQTERALRKREIEDGERWRDVNA
jgi:hypothetical protein